MLVLVSISTMPYVTLPPGWVWTWCHTRGGMRIQSPGFTLCSTNTPFDRSSPMLSGSHLYIGDSFAAYDYRAGPSEHQIELRVVLMHFGIVPMDAWSSNDSVILGRS